mgnify:FL=1
MLDITKPVRTKGHKYPVRILCTDRKSDWPVLALVEEEAGIEIALSYTLGGLSSEDVSLNLENVPTPDWRAIFRDGKGCLRVTISTYPTEQDVLQMHSSSASFVCAVKVSKD